ncbi:heterokaryon incompatibility protein-domain-containing protein [Rhypophila decipiens]|uniref:Heterokaryon incompatibility protein-domain-containing protein n=1 Tax=Rhypophila decipiens TaxID=261697 RepID=A0AAN7AZF6_9PEZI|nr:heterokaryon incompatibility protein-domain-containing protein [Rhypophila decipiens]
MLSRHHLPQPIRSYEPVSSGQVEPERGICARCSHHVFNSSLRQSLANKRNAESAKHSYSSLALDVYASVLSGCRWCTTVGNAVLTCSELDSWMEDGDEPESADCGEADADENVHSEDADMSSPGKAVYLGDEGMAEDEEYVSDATSSSESPGPHTIHSLDCTAKVDITIEFLKWRDSPVFNVVKVTAEVTTGGDDKCPIREMMGENAVVMTLEVMSTDTMNDIAVIHQRWDMVSAASFDKWVPRARAWLQACEKHHTSCATSGAFQPTRLIDLRDPRHPRLAIHSSSIKPVPYIALSYVWGPKQEYVLTQASLDTMQTGLDLTRLPRTLLDAIEATYQLAFEYLWIDALCIIQDSAEDKAQELPRMADTYRESSLCIVVGSAAAAGDGFLKPPPPPRFFVDPFEMKVGDLDEPLALTFGYRAPYRASADPISSRAWTLQERVLSRRLLIFASSGVMWMCPETFDNPSGAPDAGPPYQTSLSSVYTEAAKSDGNSDEDGIEGEHEGMADTEVRASEIRETWMSIRADYTEMDLSYCADKLPAISAIAAEMAKQTGWTYLAGMWQENLFSELHWRSTRQIPSHDQTLGILKPEKARNIGYLAPSWSWASVGLGGIVDSEDELADRQVFDFAILKCHVDPIDPAFPFGPVRGGYLQVSGKTLELGWLSENADDEASWDIPDISLIDPVDGNSIGEGTLDPLDEPLDPSQKVTCLAMSKLRLGPLLQRTVPVEGLILLPVESESGSSSTFRRIGFFRIIGPLVFDGATTRILRIE